MFSKNRYHKNNLVIIHEKKIWFRPTVAKTQPGKWPSKLTYVLLLSFAFYDLLLLFNILVLKAIIVENNILSARPFNGQITEISWKGPKHEILNPRKGGHRTLFLEHTFCKFITKDPICEEAKPLLVCMCPNERKSYLTFMLRKRNGDKGSIKA
jgi:hypothetical protein